MSYVYRSQKQERVDLFLMTVAGVLAVVNMTLLMTALIISFR